MTVAPKREAYDVVVIGAGPAGLAAAATSAEAGLSTLLLDENIGPGGQVFRAISSTPVTDRDQLGADYWVGATSFSRSARAAPRLSIAPPSGASTATSRSPYRSAVHPLSSRRSA